MIFVFAIKTLEIEGLPLLLLTFKAIGMSFLARLYVMVRYTTCNTEGWLKSGTLIESTITPVAR